MIIVLCLITVAGNGHTLPRCMSRDALKVGPLHLRQQDLTLDLLEVLETTKTSSHARDLYIVGARTLLEAPGRTTRSK